ncbi:hypothetical protein L3Y34_005714 [Caenorhabditis briggsae]|uniref:Uncharacterized protein n=2 Tax=Caenorhabditis briggsae TaxID=6238 RepID=A0AAE9D7R5_CAEBR|nr:hypothetical protein L3Y34_005714 [Caenorhabditis briggsae]
MHRMKTILLSVLFFATSIFGQTTNDDFLKKPHVLPSAERALHAVYHELDSKMSGTRNQPMFGQLYVALIEDQFTFGGDLDEWPKELFKNKNRGCKPFMGANVHHMCDDAFFLVHQDMVKLQKTAFDSSGGIDPDLNKVCNKATSGFNLGVDKDNLLYRYSHRIPMTYKGSVYENKCFGTYDTRTDTFTCMQYKDNKLRPFELQNFLWSENDGKYARGNGNVEVFCKQLHYTGN